MTSSVCPQCQEPGQVHASDTEPVRHCPSCLLPLVIIANKYKIEQTLTEGGCGVLYLSRHTKLQMDPVRVIKFIKPELCEDEKHIKRLAREVEVTAALSQRSQHIVRVFDDFDHIAALGSYYVMEYLEGEDLADLIDRELDLPYHKIFHIFRQLCEAMKDAHEAEIIHRDLKPQNVFLTQRGDDELFVKIIDFGIAKSLGNPEQTKLTGGALGTPEYMSPEQCTGHDITARTDIYAMGIILYEMLVGHTPFLPVGESNPIPMQIVLAHLKDAPVPPSEMAMKPGRTQRLVPPELDAVVLKCLAKKPSERYQSAGEVLAAIEPIARAFEETGGFASLMDEDDGNTSIQSGASLLAPWNSQTLSGQQDIQIGSAQGGEYSLGGPSKHTMDQGIRAAPPAQEPPDEPALPPQAKPAEASAVQEPPAQEQPAEEPAPRAEAMKPKAPSVELTFEQPTNNTGRLIALAGITALLLTGGWFGWRSLSSTETPHPTPQTRRMQGAMQRRPATAPRPEPARPAPTRPARTRRAAPRPTKPRQSTTKRRLRRIVKRRRFRRKRRVVLAQPRQPRPAPRPRAYAVPGCPPDQPGRHWVRAELIPSSTRLKGLYKQIQYKGSYMCVQKPANAAIASVTFEAPGFAKCIVLRIPASRRKIRIKLAKQNDDISPEMGYCLK